MRRICAVLPLAFALVGCASLPRVGPTAESVRDEEQATSDARFVVADVDETVVSIARRRAPDASLASFGAYRGAGAADTRVGVGDTISVTVWEAGAGGLFSATTLSTEKTSGGSRAAAIPEQMVGRDGTIVVPYAGRVRAAGRTTSQIQHEVERALEGKAIQPQVLITVPKPLSNTVTVIGDGSAGARLPLSARGDRILDVIATAGGIRSPINETFVQLTRGGRSARVALSRVTANASENVYLRSGDVVTVMRDPQTFLVYGATGRNAEISLDAEGITLAQALTKAGGLIDVRSDPEGVFVFRYEWPQIARALKGYSPAATSNGRVKVVYRLNMRDPNSLFLAGKLPIFKDDLVYVSDSKFTDLQKIMQLFNLAVQPVATGASIGAGVSTLGK
jgi:polysaccharide export outer membrane protein